MTTLLEEYVYTLFEIIKARLKINPTIFCFQITPEGWDEKLEHALVAGAIVDRIVSSYKVLLDGEISMRERHRGIQMISEEVEKRIALYYFHWFLSSLVLEELRGSFPSLLLKR